MNRRSAGIVFIVLSVFLLFTRYMFTAILTCGGIQYYPDVGFNNSYLLLQLSIISLAIGIIYIIISEFKKD